MYPIEGAVGSLGPCLAVDAIGRCTFDGPSMLRETAAQAFTRQVRVWDTFSCFVLNMCTLIHVITNSNSHNDAHTAQNQMQILRQNHS